MHELLINILHRWILKVSDDGAYLYNWIYVLCPSSYTEQLFRNGIYFCLQMRRERHLLCWAPYKELTRNRGGPVNEISSYVYQIYFKKGVTSNEVGIMDEQLIVTNI
jgi:hypothetical protein